MNEAVGLGGKFWLVVSSGDGGIDRVGRPVVAGCDRGEASVEWSAGVERGDGVEVISAPGNVV